MSTDRAGHIVELQSLRGIAAAAVMLGHAFNYYATPEWFHSLALLCNGRAAVVVFFVLSGYVLTRALRGRALDRTAVRRFYVQRLFRIYPAIWAASLLALAYLLLLHWRIPVANVGDGVRSQFRPDRMGPLYIIASFAGMLAFLLPQLWSIFVEIVGSAAMPAIAVLTRRGGAWTLGLLGAALLASYAIGQHTYYYVGLYFMDFVVGAALVAPGRLIGGMLARAPARLLVAAGMVALALTQYLPGSYYDPSAHLVETALAAGVIALLVHGRQRVALLAARPLVFLGDISYSVYLLHYVVLCTLAKAFAAAGLALPPIPAAGLLAAATVLVTLPLAALSFRWIEQPGVQAGKAVLARWPGRTGRVAQAGGLAG
jgi:peptidoglycan/LPS O-acetylase OafA/YrhL